MTCIEQRQQSKQVSTPHHLEFLISLQAFPDLADKFSDFIWSASKMMLSLEAALEDQSRDKRMKYLFKLFAKFVVENHAQELTQYRCCSICSCMIKEGSAAFSLEISF